MDPTHRTPEIFAPFGEAFDLTKRILFKPFDIGKWFVIGFAAWLATFFGGGSLGFRRYFDKAGWSWRARHEGPPFSWHDTPVWAIPVAIVGFLVVVALIALFLWLNGRGRFMFTDCIVRNRGAIVEPWREYRKEGNSYFLFQLAVSLCCLVLVGVFVFCFVLAGHWTSPVLPMATLIPFGLGWLLFLILYGTISHLMVAAMYRQRCGALAAFRQVWALLMANLGIFILFILFYILLCIAAMMIGCIAGCVTCCLAAIPYLGTVILLPVVMVLFAFPLCFMRQFGDAFDVWATVPAIEPPPPQVPPVQEGLPPV